LENVGWKGGETKDRETQRSRDTNPTKVWKVWGGKGGETKDRETQTLLKSGKCGEERGRKLKIERHKPTKVWKVWNGKGGN